MATQPPKTRLPGARRTSKAKDAGSQAALLDLAAVVAQDADDDLHQRALPRAVLAHEADQLSLADH